MTEPRRDDLAIRREKQRRAAITTSAYQLFAHHPDDAESLTRLKTEVMQALYEHQAGRARVPGHSAPQLTIAPRIEPSEST